MLSNVKNHNQRFLVLHEFSFSEIANLSVLLDDHVTDHKNAVEPCQREMLAWYFRYTTDMVV